MPITGPLPPHLNTARLMAVACRLAVNQGARLLPEEAAACHADLQEAAGTSNMDATASILCNILHFELDVQSAAVANDAAASAVG